MPPPADGREACHYGHQEGAQVYKFAVARMAEISLELMLRTQAHPTRSMAGAAPSQQAHSSRRPRRPGSAEGQGDGGRSRKFGNHHAGTIP